MASDETTQKLIDKFYEENGACCAGCDFWRWHSAVIGDCIKTVPLSGDERSGLLDMGNCSLDLKAGHIITGREHVCGEFIDSKEKPLQGG